MRKELQNLRIDKEKKSASSSGTGRLSKLLNVVLAAFLLGLLFYLFRPFGLSPTNPDEVETNVAAAEADSAVPAEEDPPPEREVLVVSGYVVAHHRISLGSKVMGKVEWIGVEKGDRVKKGQLLVKLEDREYRAQLNQSKAALESARARLTELETGSRPQEIERAEAEQRRAGADLANARLEFERIQGLFDDGVVSAQDLDNARSRHQMAEAALGVAKKNLELARLGPRSEQILQAQGEVGRLQASVEYYQTLLDATEIRAPVTGTVLRRIAEVGEMITTSFAGEQGAKSAVVSLADLNDLQVELDVSQRDFSRISRQHSCEMTPEAFPDRRYACEIDEISPEADRQKATIQVKVKVLDPDEYLRPEMSARVTFSEKEDGA